MSTPLILTCNSDEAVAMTVSKFAKENGYESCATADAGPFKKFFIRWDPVLIVYDFYAEFFDGIELVQWLIAENSTADVAMTDGKGIGGGITGAATALAENTNKFRLSVLPFGESSDDVLATLKI